MEDISRRYAVGLLGVSFGAIPARAKHSPATSSSRSDASSSKDDGDGWYRLGLASAQYLPTTVLVNGRSVAAIVDTGASRTVINRALAEEIGLPRLGQATAKAFTGNVSGALYNAATLEVGGSIFRDTIIADYSLSAIEGSLMRGLPFVVGQDILSKLLFEVDFPHDRARFVSHTQSEYFELFERVELSIDKKGLPQLGLGFGSSPTAPALIDLGSSVVCSVSRAFADREKLTVGKRTSTTLTVGVEGEEVSTVFCAPNVRLGNFLLHDVPICIVDNWKPAQPINIGWPLFASFDLLVKIRESVIYLKANNAVLGRPFPKDRSGIGAVRLPDRLRVRHVAANSPAEHAGLLVGDEIVSLNGRPIDASYPPVGERQGYKAAGTRIELTLTDGRVLDVVLVDYF